MSMHASLNPPRVRESGATPTESQKRALNRKGLRRAEKRALIQTGAASLGISPTLFVQRQGLTVEPFRARFGTTGVVAKAILVYKSLPMAKANDGCGRCGTIHNPSALEETNLGWQSVITCVECGRKMHPQVHVPVRPPSFW